MSAITIIRPKTKWSVSPRTVLPTALLLHLFKRRSNYVVVLDAESVGKIGSDEVRVFNVEPGEHRLHMRFVGLRKSEELQVSLEEGEKRQFLCGTSGMGWPTLREVSSEDAAQIRRTSISEREKRGDDPGSPD